MSWISKDSQAWGHRLYWISFEVQGQSAIDMHRLCMVLPCKVPTSSLRGVWYSCFPATSKYPWNILVAHPASNLCCVTYVIELDCLNLSMPTQFSWSSGCISIALSPRQESVQLVECTIQPRWFGWCRSKSTLAERRQRGWLFQKEVLMWG